MKAGEQAMLARVERLEALADEREAAERRQRQERSEGWGACAGSAPWPDFMVEWAREGLGLDPERPHSAGLAGYFCPLPEALEEKARAAMSETVKAAWFYGYATAIHPYLWAVEFYFEARDADPFEAGFPPFTTRRALTSLSLLAGASVRRLAALPSAPWFLPEWTILRAWIAALHDLLIAYKAEVDRALAALAAGDEDLDPAPLSALSRWRAPDNSGLEFRLEFPGEAEEDVLARGRAENEAMLAGVTPTTATRR